MLSSVSPVLMRSPPITSGYSRPSSPATLSRAARIAAAFSSLLKSVNGSFLNSEGIDELRSIQNPHFAIRNSQFEILCWPVAGSLQLSDFSQHQFALQRR